MTDETAICRNCNKELMGKPYHLGGAAYIRRDGFLTQVPVNFYGGFVCSRNCDIEVCLAVERTMPGHNGSQKTPSQPALTKVNKNWNP